MQPRSLNLLINIDFCRRKRRMNPPRIITMSFPSKYVINERKCIHYVHYVHYRFTLKRYVNAIHYINSRKLHYYQKPPKSAGYFFLSQTEIIGLTRHIGIRLLLFQETRYVHYCLILYHTDASNQSARGRVYARARVCVHARQVV